MKSILDYRKPNIFRMLAIAVLFSFLGIMMYYVTPFFTGYLIDTIIAGKKTNQLTQWLLISFVFAVILHSYLFYFLKYIWDKYGVLLANEVRYLISEKIIKSEAYEYEKFNHGYIFNLIFQDATTVGGVTLTYIASSLVSIFRIIACLAILFFINSKMTLISLLFIPVYLITMSFNGKKLQENSSEERKKLDSLVLFTRKEIEGKVHINLFRQEAYFRNKFQNKIDEWTAKKLKYSFWYNLTKEIPQFVSTIAPFVVMAIGAGLIINGELTLGRLVMFSQYVGMLFEPLNILSQAVVERRATVPIFERVDEFLNNESKPIGLPYRPYSDKLVEIKNYSILKRDGEPLFTVPDLKIDKAGIYIICGDNGVGKSTLLNILSSINNPEMLHPISEKSYCYINETLPERLTYLYQPGFLFEGTVRENITFGEKANSLLGELVEVLGIDYLEKEISFNPINLSLGEQQKIFLARVFLQGKDLILLDEPLTNLDMETKVRLIDYIRRIKSTKTFLIITHDTELKEIADTILEITNGQITLMCNNTSVENVS